MKTIEEKAILICDGYHGVHIPHLVVRMFIENDWLHMNFNRPSDIRYDWSDVAEESVNTLLNGCDEEFYWESWEDVLDNLKIEIDGEPYRMLQNQDVWLIPEDCMDEEVSSMDVRVYWR